MNELWNIGIKETDMKNILEINPNIKDLEEEIVQKILLLKKINCNEKQIRNIIICNPFYFNRTNDDLINLIYKLNDLGITNLNITFDTNPFLLNKDALEIDEFIEEKINEGMSQEEAIDLIDSGMMD